jgi:hypothetical protein
MTHPRPVMRPGLALAAAALVGTATLSPSSAAPVNAIVVQAARSAYVDVELTRPGRVQPARPMQVVGGGRYASLLVMPLDPETGRAPIAAGETRLRDLDDHRQVEGIGDLRPGRYRLVVLTDRPVRLSLPLQDGSEGVQATATRPVAVRYAVGTGTVAATLGASGAEVRLPGAVPAGFQAHLTARVDGGARLEQTRVCAAAPRAACRGRLLPLSPPSPLPPQPDAQAPVPATDESYPLARVAADASAREAVLAVEGLRVEPSDLRLVALAFRLP